MMAEPVQSANSRACQHVIIEAARISTCTSMVSIALIAASLQVSNISLVAENSQQALEEMKINGQLLGSDRQHRVGEN